MPTIRHLILCLALALPLVAQAADEKPEQIRIDASASTEPFPHFWEQMYGSGRASLALRDDYRKDLEKVKGATGFQYVRFHGIFDRDVGIIAGNRDGAWQYNWSYVDQIYDGLLERGIKPFVELSFMPPELSSDPKALHAFWYHQNIAPPKDYKAWNAMMQAFARHLIERYGIGEVSSWYFEVWNEPNGFWSGRPVESTYLELYDNTARALKAVDKRIRVGGPSTAQAAMVPAFLAHVKKENVPVDFLSTHVYGDDTAQNVFKTDEKIPRSDMVCRAVDKVHKEILASPYPHLPFIMSEFNASYANLPNVTDTVYMGPWMANTIRLCAGKVDIMSYWSFSDVFEEQGVVRTPFYGGFGLIAADRIPKPAFNAFALLHKLGDERLPAKTDSALVTRRKDGTVVIAAWNYAEPVGNTDQYTPGKPKGDVRHFQFDVAHGGGNATVWRVDETHGNAVAAFDAMGRPPFPSREQIVQLRKAGEMAPAEHVAISGGKLGLDIPPQGLVVVEIPAAGK
ncbi:GH39 family glycosyl hydrolase [Pinirhizobacter sp.]|uniref:GH39 family glycosyl hydrolase n=1 Tax=Pinirhizobacter sp. TaxID=2950432 RepID=UPI002F3E4861